MKIHNIYMLPVRGQNGLLGRSQSSTVTLAIKQLDVVSNLLPTLQTHRATRNDNRRIWTAWIVPKAALYIIFMNFGAPILLLA